MIIPFFYSIVFHRLFFCLLFSGWHYSIVKVVLPLVLPTLVAPVEGGLAELAFVWFVAVVFVHVRAQVAIGRQLLVAHQTWISETCVAV